MTVAVHVTHEAMQKFGGIGTVLHGLITEKNYHKVFKNTLLYTPLFHWEGDPLLRLGRDSKVLYSGLDSYDHGGWHPRFSKIEEKHGIKIVYGKRGFRDSKTGKFISDVDIVAVDIWHMKGETVDGFKFRLWEKFGIQSERYKGDSDYEQYLRIGAVLRDIFEALYGHDEKAVIFSHEYMGMASALAFVIDKLDGRRSGDKTVFYAHEVSTARMIVEGHAGHDLTFYNILYGDRAEGISLEDEFGSYSHYSRNELIKRAADLDFVFAVSDITRDEYLYLCPGADESKIKAIYNGIPVEKVSYSEKEKGLRLVREYCGRLFNFEPDYIMTHVARLVVSKGMWRDIRLLYHLDESFARRGKKGFFVLLTSLLGDGRPEGQIAKMEAEYGWPVVHKKGWPDLEGGETALYEYLELFNARSKAIKGVLVNQFGFSQRRCGARMPADMSLLYLRLASDIEFGLSIYEPFGIAQLETLPYGGAPVLSSVCGCASLLENTLDKKDYLKIDFTKVPPTFADILKTKADFHKITIELRDLIESDICERYVPKLISMLPRSDKDRQERFKRMQKKSELLDWEHVVKRIHSHLQSTA